MGMADGPRGGATGSADATPPAEGPANRATDLRDLDVSNHDRDGADHSGLLIPVSSTASNEESNPGRAEQPSNDEQEFEKKYDDLGPVDFAKEVIQFGDWLGRAGANLSPEEKEHALAEYSFLQNRLSFWLNYDHTPPMAQGNLRSAALTLYQGAINGGIVGVGNLPESMLAVRGAASFITDGAPRIRPTTKPAFGDAPATPPQRPKEIEGTGRIVDNSEANIAWGKGIKEQSGNWEDYIANENREASKLRPGAPVFDHFNVETGEAISAKTLNTLTVNRIKNPQKNI
jgi:CDI toxin restriction endonuclease-like domain